MNEHAPPLQPAPVVFGLPVQSLAHVPQLVGVVSAASQPLPPMLSQSPKPVEHVPRSQLPLVQTDVAFGREQAFPHMPQLLTAPRSVSQPLDMLPSQFAKPLLHVI